MAVALVMIISAIPVVVGIPEGPAGAPTGPAAPVDDFHAGTELEALLDASPTHSPPGDELVEKRTANTKFYRTDDGRMFAEVFVADAHYRGADGSWQDIHLDITPKGDGFENRHNTLVTEFPGSLHPGSVLATDGDGAELEWSLLSMGVRSGGGYTPLMEPSSATGTVDINVITYTDTFPGISDRYMVGPNKVKHDIIIDSPEALPEGGEGDMLCFAYTLDLPVGGSMVADGEPVAGETLTFSPVMILDDSGKTVRTIAAPAISDDYTPAELFAVDSTVPADWTRSCAYRITPAGDGGSAGLTIEVPYSWLNMEHRSYPLVIDPPTTIQPGSEGQDSFIGDEGEAPVHTYNFGADPSFWFSTDTPQSYIPLRILVKLDVSGVSTAVQSATLSYNYFEDQDTDYSTVMTSTIHDVSQSWVEGSGTIASVAVNAGVNWDTSDGTSAWTQGAPHSGTTSGTTTSSSIGWMDFTGSGMTTLVEGWKSGTNNGCLMKTTGGDNVRSVRTSDYATANDRPKLVLELGGPQAEITSIDPNPAEEGQVITFTGSAEDTLGGTIVKYEWNSDLDGVLYSGANSSFTSKALTPGDHVIKLRAQNNGLDWSSWTPGTDLKVNPDATAPSIDYVISQVGYDDDDDYPENSEVLITVAEEFGEEELSGQINIRDYIGTYVVDADPLVDSGSGEYTYLWDAEGLPPGEYSVDVFLIDPAENKDDRQAVDLVITLRDVTAPVIDQVYSAVGADGDGTYPMDSTVRITVVEKNREDDDAGTITINSTDSEGNEEDVIVNSAPLENLGDGNYYYDWDTAGLPYGKYNVETTLWDMYGNKDSNGLTLNPDIVITLEDVRAPIIDKVTTEVGKDKDNEYLIGATVTITIEEKNNEEDLTPTLIISPLDDAKEPEYVKEKRGEYEFKWKTSGAEPGDFYVWGLLEDASGNVGGDIDDEAHVIITLDHERVPPEIVMSTPYIGQTEVPQDAPITISFSEDIDPGTIDKDNFELEDSKGTKVKFTLEYDNETGQYPTVYMFPETTLLSLTEYTVTISRFVTDLIGNEMDTDFDIYFTTAFGDDPEILRFYPKESFISFNATETHKFNITYTPDTEDVFVEWYKNDTKLRGGSDKYTLKTTMKDAGKTYLIKVKVFKGEGDDKVTVEHAWTVEVLDPEAGDGGGGDGGSTGGSNINAEGSNDSLLWVMIILAVVIAVVMLMVVLMIVQKKKKREEEARRRAEAERQRQEYEARMRAEEEARMARQAAEAAAQAQQAQADAGYGAGYDPYGASPQPTVYGADYGGGMGSAPAPTPVQAGAGAYPDTQLGAGYETPALPPAPADAGGTQQPTGDLSSWGTGTGETGAAGDAGAGADVAAGAGAGAAAGAGTAAAGAQDKKPEEKQETVECFECGTDVPLTSTKRPLLITCPKCGTKGLIED